MAPKKIAAGNWKMNGLHSALNEASALANADIASHVRVVLCPPATLLAAMNATLGAVPEQGVQLGGQTCHTARSGAHTGDISAEMLKDAGATHVIVGHSERRTDHAESDAEVKTQATTAIDAGLVAILCIGETLQEREAGKTLEILGRQLENSLPDAADFKVLVVAYEPVWAIGTGKVATLDQIAEVHGFVRGLLVGEYGAGDGAEMSILYGGSVKPDNAAAIFATENVDGALVGGASLKAADFIKIINALAAA